MNPPLARVSPKEMTLSRTCSPCSYEHNALLFMYIYRILVMHGILEGNITLTKKIAPGHTVLGAHIDIENGQEVL